MDDDASYVDLKRTMTLWDLMVIGVGEWKRYLESPGIITCLFYGLPHPDAFAIE